MKRIRMIGVLALVLMMAALASPAAKAGRIGGPMSAVGMVPLGESVYYSMSFTEGDRAIVSVKGNGQSILHLLLYDTDGHIAIGVGGLDTKTVIMDVYRTGVFRVEVRNLGVRDSAFQLTTN